MNFKRPNSRSNDSKGRSRPGKSADKSKGSGKSGETPKLPTARHIASTALAKAAANFPDITPPTLALADLDPSHVHRESRLTLAIYRSTVQRWLTLEAILNKWLRRPLETLEPGMQGVLLAGSAQILLMDRIPVYAVVDEMVRVAGFVVRSGARGMVNAVLRRLAEQVGPPVLDKPWKADASRLPLEIGYMPLQSPLLPPLQPIEHHLAIATSHPRPLVERWIAQFGAEQTTQLCLHGIRTPPIIVAVETGFDPVAYLESHKPEPAPAAPEPDDEESDADSRIPKPDLTPKFTAHETVGFIVWQSSHAALVEFLKGHVSRRVQDPSSSIAVRSTESISPKVILDFCAGRGTKTRQLALLHPNARIIATDIDPYRVEGLKSAMAAYPNVTPVAMDELADVLPPFSADLILLDVPCSNTGVLARRPEARYRFGPESMQSLSDLQRGIITQAAAYLSPTGHILYSTCSLDESENQAQARWIQSQTPARIIAESLTFPAGHGVTHRDGSYHALIARS